MTLKKNILIEWITPGSGTRVDRILWIDLSNDNLVTIDVEINNKNKIALPIFQKISEVETALVLKEAKILQNDPYDFLRRPDETFLERHRNKRDKIWTELQSLINGEFKKDQEKGELSEKEVELFETLIKDIQDKRLLIFIPEIRGFLVSKFVERTGWTKKTIYGHLKRYWQRGQMPNAVLPDYHQCGGKGKEKSFTHKKRGRPNKLSRKENKSIGINITPEIREKFKQGIRQFYQKDQKLPLTMVYVKIIGTFFNKGYETKNGVLIPILPEASQLPTWDQFLYWFEKETDSKKSLLMREGERQYNRRYRAVTGDSTQMAFGPGSLFQLDATIGDIYLVSSLDRTRIIGRPVIYVVIDVFSRLIVGIAVTLEGPSWLGMMLALENSSRNKVEFCKEYGIEIIGEEWPAHYLPEEYLGDRGELEGYNADQLANGLNIRVSNTAPYRCDWKGIVEQNFRLINNEVIHWLPGAVYKPRERGDKDYRLDATLTLFEFRQLLIYCVLNHNHCQYMPWYRRDQFAIQDQVSLFPISLWNWGLQNRTGLLRDYQDNLDIVRLNLLPKATASVTASGIRFRGRLYSCELASKEYWFEKARQKRRWPIEIVYDPRKVDLIYLRLEQGRKLEPCSLLDKELVFAGKDWSELLDYDEILAQEKQLNQTQQLQSAVEFQAKIEHITASASEKTEEAQNGLSNRSRITTIRQNRSDEKQSERDRDAWDLTATEGASTQSHSINPRTKSEPSNNNEYIPPVDLTEKIQKKREEKQQQKEKL